MNWIDVNKQQPEVYQDVVFIVESWDKHYNKRILGGRYQGFRYGDDEFSVPGIFKQVRNSKKQNIQIRSFYT